jgi:catechol 2,3-dioxygenase-like lactoylglutathione lyase family enzyme
MHRRLRRTLVSLALGLLANCANGGHTMTKASSSQHGIFVPSANAAVVRYLTDDAERTIAFYTQHLGFSVTQRSGPIAVISRGELHLLLSGAASSGARPMPDGRKQEPGGWNRIVLYVDSIEATIAALKQANARFRNQIEVGPGGKQILVDDPDGNPIELHEAPK